MKHPHSKRQPLPVIDSAGPTSPILSWRRFEGSTKERVVARLGADHVAWILSQPAPAIVARGRARGMWDANEGESYSAYNRLADLIEAGEVRS